MTAAPVLEVQDLEAGYGGLQVLHGVSATIRPGTITCAIGPNGAGKSTFLRALAGLVGWRRGTIRFRGEDIAACAPGAVLARGISLVPQGRCNFPLMTVRENLEMGAYTRRDARVAEDLAAAEARFPVLQRRRRVLAGNLSGGEQQILEMAMALLLRPALLLLDEPSLGLAPGPMMQVFAEVRRLAAEGTTVLMVEQNARSGLEISDQALVFELGRLRLAGAGREILADPEVRRLYLGGRRAEAAP